MSRTGIGIGLSVVLGSLLAAACGGSDSINAPGGGSGGSGGPDAGSTGGSGGSGTAGVALADVPAQLADTLCQVTAQCLGPLLPAYLQGSDCKTTQTEALTQGEFALIQNAVDARRVTYDGTKIPGCISAIETAGCRFFSMRLATLCPGVVTGTVAEGGDCTINAECKTGTFCQAGSTCPGKCTALLGAGSACEKSDACRDGFVCSDKTKTCVTPGATGVLCGGTGGDDTCLSDLVCSGKSGTNPGTCQPITSAFSADEGAACDPVAAVLCKTGLVCAALSVDAASTITWKCEKPPTTTACHVSYPEECPTGQFCALVPNTLAGTCKPLPGDGEPCGAHAATDKTKDLCAKNTTCVAGTCKAVQRDGAACTTDAECFSTTCANSRCMPSRCGALPAK